MSYKHFHFLNETVQLCEMPYMGMHGKAVDFYAEKDPKWILTHFMPYAEKWQHDPDFIKEMGKSFVITWFRKYYNQLNPLEKKSVLDKLTHKVQDVLLGQNK